MADWLSRTLIRKFLLMLAGFLLLQAFQLGAGIIGTMHIGEEAAVLNEAGRQRMRLLLLGTLAGEAVDAGAWQPARRKWFLEILEATDRQFRRTAGDRDSEAEAHLDELREQNRADWERNLRPLLAGIDPAADPSGSRAAASRYRERSFPALRRVDAFVGMMEFHAREDASRLAAFQAGVLALSLVFGVIGFGMALRLVSRPLQRLTEATAAMADGAYERRVPVASRDELGQLAETFNRMAEAVSGKTARLHSLNRVAAAVTASLKLNDVLNEIMLRGAELTGAKAACIALYDARSGMFSKYVTHGLSEHFVRNMSFRPGGLADETFTHNSYVLSNDLPGTRYRLSRLAREEGLRSFVCLPLTSHAHRLGVLYIYRSDRDSFLPDEIESLGTFASLAASAIENARLHEEMRDMAITDRLTGLRNRRLFDQHLIDEVARAERGGSPPALLLLDIDHFKRVNDTYGHVVGDQVLQEVARRFASGLRQSDLAARFGGEEFAAVLPATDGAGAMRVAEHVRRAIADAPVQIAGHRALALTLSAGISTYPASGMTPEQLIEHADQALYTAKREGRNRAFLYEQTPTAILERTPAQVSELLKQGIDRLPLIVTAMSAKAAFFRNHAELVSETATRLADALGLLPKDRESLRLAGLLHDIGMIGMPGELLSKLEGLSGEDLDQVRTHASIGADMIERVPALKHLVPIVRHHHERFDGGGYPDGIGGNAIPYLARVLAVADAYGAMVSGWVGRTPEPEAKAMQGLRAVAGTQLDPDIVSALVSPRPEPDPPDASAARDSHADATGLYVSSLTRSRSSAAATGGAAITRSM